MNYSSEDIDQLWEDFRCSNLDDNSEIHESQITVDRMFNFMHKCIRDEVEREYEAELKALKTELEELKEFRDKRDEFESAKQLEISAIRACAERQIKDFRNACLEDLLYSDRAYTVALDLVRPEKCDLCDENRKRKFISPLGREMTEPCTCAKYINLYKVVEAPLYRISEEKHSVYRYYYKDGSTYWSAHVLERKESTDAFYRYATSRQEYMGTNDYSKDSSDVAFEDLNRYNAFFWNREDAQKYADWLTAKELSNDN